MYNQVLVTGGSGFLGRRLQKYKPEWTYLSSQDCDLLDKDSVREMLEEYSPEAVIHLAGTVGGIKANSEYPADFLYNNSMMSLNLIHQGSLSGVDRMLISLSTCAFPDTANEYPMTEDDLYSGKPAETNISYGFSKRLSHIQALSYRKQYNRNYSTFSPSNLYGIGDHFDTDSSHFISSLISKVAKASHGDTLEMWGTGKPLRQHLYVDDLCQVIPKLLQLHNTEVPVIVAPNENLSISESCNILNEISGKKLKFTYNGKYDGQYRKDGSNNKLHNIIGDFNYTTFEEGIRITYGWYTNLDK
jgi:GDP-L-fucose synthase